MVIPSKDWHPPSGDSTQLKGSPQPQALSNVGGQETSCTSVFI